MSGGPTSGGFGMPYHRPSSSAAPPPPPTAPDTLRISVVSCANLKIKDRGFFGVGGSSDPFVQLVLGDEKMRTRTIKKDLNPRFEETFEVQLIGDGHARGRALTVPLEVTVWDEDLGGLKQDFIGKIAVDFVAPDVVRYQLCDRKGKPDVGRGTVELKLELVDTSCQWFKEPLDDVTKPPNEFRIALLRGRKLKAMDGILCSTSDPYVVLTVDSPECVAEFRTATRMRTLSPVWDEEFAFEASQDATVHLTVYDYDVGRKDDVLDHARLSLQQLVARPPGGKPTKHAQAAVCRWLPLDRRSEVLVVAQWRYSARIAAPFRGAHVDALAFAFPEALRGDVSNLYDDYDGDVQSACAALTLKYVGGAGRSFRFAHAPVRLNSFIKSDVHRDPTASDSPPRRDSDDSVTPDDGLTATEDLTWSYFAEETNPLLAEAAAAVNANANAANADAANADANAPAGDTPRSVAARLLRAQPAVALLPTAVGLDRSKRIKIETTFSLENNTLEEQSSVRLWAAEHFQGETMLKVAVHRSARDFVTLRQGLEYKLARTAAVARGGADELPELPPWIAKLANFKPIQRDARRFATAASVGAIGLVGVSAKVATGGLAPAVLAAGGLAVGAAAAAGVQLGHRVDAKLYESHVKSGRYDLAWLVHVISIVDKAGDAESSAFLKRFLCHGADVAKAPKKVSFDPTTDEAKGGFPDFPLTSKILEGSGVRRRIKKLLSRTKSEKAMPKPMDIGNPTDFQRLTHVEAKDAGFTGLPPEWQRALEAAGLSEEQIGLDPDAAVDALAFTMRRSTIEPEEEDEEEFARSTTLRRPNQLHLPTASEVDLHLDRVFSDEIEERDPVPGTFDGLEKLGSGVTGVVYAATDVRTGAKVALKYCPLAELKHLKTEIALQRLCSHANVVNLLEAFQTKEDVILVLELMTAPLTNLCDDPNAEMHIAYVLEQTLAALEFMHGQHRLHRDIKSDNLLVDLEGRVKVADFGFAAPLSKQQQQRASVVGTPCWMAPELIRAEQYGCGVDCWSLGIVGIELAQCIPPYMDEPPMRALFMIAANAPPVLDEPWNWSDSFSHFLHAALVKDPSQRASSASLRAHPFAQSKCTQAEFAILVKQRLAASRD